jgi:hypothetical protein
MVSNHRRGFIRAWHGHKKEGKYVFVPQGSAIVCAIKIDNWENPSKNLDIERYVLSDKSPSILRIPPGYANGFSAPTLFGTISFIAKKAGSGSITVSTGSFALDQTNQNVLTPGETVAITVEAAVPVQVKEQASQSIVEKSASAKVETRPSVAEETPADLSGLAQASSILAPLQYSTIFAFMLGVILTLLVRGGIDFLRKRRS